MTRSVVSVRERGVQTELADRARRGDREAFGVLAAGAVGRFDVTVHDDNASVCRGATSTTRGLAEAKEPGTIAIAQPDLSL